MLQSPREEANAMSEFLLFKKLKSRYMNGINKTEVRQNQTRQKQMKMQQKFESKKSEVSKFIKN
jgi:hypothetical protein